MHFYLHLSSDIASCFPFHGRRRNTCPYILPFVFYLPLFADYPQITYTDYLRVHIREHLSLTTSGQGLKIILKFDIAYPHKKKKKIILSRLPLSEKKKKKRSNRKDAGYKSRFNREPN